MPRTIKLTQNDKAKLIAANGTVVYSIRKVRNCEQYCVLYANWLNKEQTAISTQKTKCFDAENKEELVERMINLWI